MKKDPTLFEDNKLDNITDEPVSVFGITFFNDEERKTYFRDELRKKLPELKKLEGFPTGSDDDIINLSDPPYYTACPNPWINDFIDEWEHEKRTLQKEGRRSATFEVKEPYAVDVSEGKNNPIYMAHAYHTKVPHPAIMRYILHYTQPGDIVFDGFAGTGMTGVAANMCGLETEVAKLNERGVNVGCRHGICIDLSSIATLIAAGYNGKFNIKSFETRAKNILNQVNDELGWMYETDVKGNKGKIKYTIWSQVFICPSCGKELVFWNEAVSEDTTEISDSFKCPHCGCMCNKRSSEKAWETQFDTILETPTTTLKFAPVRVNGVVNNRRFEIDIQASDKALLDSISKITPTNYHTAKILIGDESARIQNYGFSHFHQFYTKRNYITLSRIYELVKDDLHLLTWFTSSLMNLSKMYKFRTDRKGSILYGTLYFPSLNIEFNPISALFGKLRDFISTFYLSRGNSVVSTNSATSLTNIHSNSVDYIFVDPPFGSNLMYSELNSLWEGWIGVSTNNKEEAIVNSSQGKTLFDYQVLMNYSLKEFYRILKSGKWLTMEFSNTSAAVWNSIQNALQGVGFVVVNVAALDKKQGSFKAVTSPTAVKQDLIITCFKPTDELTEKFTDSVNTDMNVWDFVEELLKHLPVHLQKGQSTTAVVERSPKILFDRLISFYVQHGYNVPMNAQEFQKGLKEHFVERDGMYFAADQVIEYEEKKRQTRDFIQTSLLISNETEGIEWLKRKLEERQMTYSDIQPMWLQDVIPSRKGDKLPELMQILEENFLKDEDGKWRIPDQEKESDLEKLRTRKLLKEFDVYYEMATKQKGKIKEARLEALRAGFKHCYQEKDFAKIVNVGNKLPESLLMEDDVLLQYYDIASSRV